MFVSSKYLFLIFYRIILCKRYSYHWHYFIEEETWSCAGCSVWTCFSSGVGRDDPQRTLL